MNCIELSIEKLENECREWAYQIKKDFVPDIIVYVAKAGYLIARPMATVFQAPLVGIEAVRKGNGIKTILGPIMSMFPNCIRNLLISAELKTRVHNKNCERKVKFHKGKEKLNKGKISRVLVLDDSVDTGHSMLKVVESIKAEFPVAEVRTAALNIWSKSENLIKTDYSLYKNIIIKTPMSKDSKEYAKFFQLYNDETLNGYM